MTALHYQLAHARHDGEFDAMVLADTSGCVVAGAGAWPTCELLAAYAPLLAQRPESGSPPADLDGVGDDVQIRSLLVDGSEVLLCARGGGSRSMPSITRAASGCRRILGAEA
jgi:hypothetical protein